MANKYEKNLFPPCIGTDAGASEMGGQPLSEVRDSGLCAGLGIGTGHITAQNAAGTGDNDDFSGKIMIQRQFHSKNILSWEFRH